MESTTSVGTWRPLSFASSSARASESLLFPLAVGPQTTRALFIATVFARASFALLRAQSVGTPVGTPVGTLTYRNARVQYVGARRLDGGRDVAARRGVGIDVD